MFFIPTCFSIILAFICIMTQLFTLETSNICFIFLDLSFTLLTLLLFIFQVPTTSLLVPILSTMVAPSFKEPLFVPFLNVSTLIASTLYFIFRPTMFPLELQVVLLFLISSMVISVDPVLLSILTCSTTLPYSLGKLAKI